MTVSTVRMCAFFTSRNIRFRSWEMLVGRQNSLFGQLRALQWLRTMGLVTGLGNAWRGGGAFTLTVLTTMLAGCPDESTSGSPGKTPPQATAPAVSAAHGSRPAAGTSVASAATAPQAANTPASADPVRAQKVQQLIAQAEHSYASGVTNYRAGRLDAARADFDSAVDLMLTSGMDLKADPQLSDEFDRLLSQVNSLEMAALKQGNGFSPPVEETPLEATEDLTFAPNPELAAKLKTELNVTSDLPLVINDQVAGYIGVFSTSSSFRAHMAASLQRVGKYRGLIQDVLRQEQVPQDLIYLAVAESGFQPQAINPKSGAGGMWQFMTYTAPEYGLTRNSYFDYRFDPEKSTRAYARLIKNYYRLFGDWYLAMAAYDWGPLNIQRVVQRTGYADYWELYRRNTMPAETRDYVPKILAAVIMAKNPERYGLDKLTPSPPVIYDTISTDYGIDLQLVADLTDVSVSEIVALNPSLLRLATPNDTPFDLHIPPGTKDVYNERLKEVPVDRRGSWRFHVARQGETLESIAATLHAHAEEIAEVNGFAPGTAVETGDELVIPVATAASVSRPQRYTPRRGETLTAIADRFNITVADLRRWNHLTSNNARPGRSLEVSEPMRLRPAAYARGRFNRQSRMLPMRSRRGASATARSRRGASSSHSGTHATTRSAPARRPAQTQRHAAR